MDEVHVRSVLSVVVQAISASHELLQSYLLSQAPVRKSDGLAAGWGRLYQAGIFTNAHDVKSTVSNSCDGLHAVPKRIKSTPGFWMVLRRKVNRRA